MMALKEKEDAKREKEERRMMALKEKEDAKREKAKGKGQTLKNRKTVQKRSNAKTLKNRPMVEINEGNEHGDVQGDVKGDTQTVKTIKKRKLVIDKPVKNNTLKNITPMTCPTCRININTNSKKYVQHAIQHFKEGGLSVLENLNEKTLNAMLKLTNDVYRNMGENDSPLISDNLYDILEDYIKEKYPKNTAVGKIGAPVSKNKVTLPYEMASMDKIKPDTKALSVWKNKYSGPYVLSCKLDGVSGMYTTEGDQPKLYTRGDGKVGQDVDLIPV